MSFSKLGLANNIVTRVEEVGYSSPTPIQEKAIPVILNGHDVMARAQTGTGKTAAFALPLLQKLQLNTANELLPLGIQILVLTPTRELAQQVYKNFVNYAETSEIKIALAHGGVSINPQITQLKEGAQVLIATPGRLLDHLINQSLTLDCLQCLVFDEADRMLDLGFKNEIESILRRLPSQHQTLLFSATFDEAIYKLRKKLLNDPIKIEVDEQNTAAESVEQIVYAVDSSKKRELLSYMIGSKNWQQVLIFTRTKQTADLLAKELCKDGIKSLAIHGDKSQGARDKALASFKERKIRALVATDVAARGIDIVDLQYVVNYELPYVAEDYVHRIGRTGRAGKQGIAVSLMSANEDWLLTAVEKVLDERLLQQWYVGYEPSGNDESTGKKTSKKPTSKKRARQDALGANNRNNTNNKNSKRSSKHKKSTKY